MRFVILLYNLQYNHRTNEQRGSKTRQQENGHSNTYPHEIVDVFGRRGHAGGGIHRAFHVTCFRGVET